MGCFGSPGTWGTGPDPRGPLDKTAVAAGCVLLLCQTAKNRAANDGYCERGMNTFNDLPKDKTAQTDRILHSDASAFASICDLYDTYTAVQGACITFSWISQSVRPGLGSVVSRKRKVTAARWKLMAAYHRLYD